MPRLLRSEQDQRLVTSHGPDYLEILARGLRVVTSFTADRRQMTLSEVAVAAGLPRATARRALFTLEKLGYVTSDGRIFRLTAQVLELAAAYLASNSVSVVAQPVVDHVCREVGETCSVGVLDGPDVVFVARASPKRVISVDLAVGYRLPAYATAIGRVLLGGLPDDLIEAYFAELKPAKLTPGTTVEKPRLRAAVSAAREEGFCIVDEEVELGLRSAAVPVHRYDGALVCSVQVGVRIEQVSLDRMREEILPVMRKAADEIGRALV